MLTKHLKYTFFVEYEINIKKKCRYVFKVYQPKIIFCGLEAKNYFNLYVPKSKILLMLKYTFILMLTLLTILII